MPSKPRKAKLEATTPEILNAIRAEASDTYRELVPPAKADDLNSLKSIGKVVMEFQPIKNEFLNALVNRIAMVRITNQLYYNPWSFFKQGKIENGETVEEIFTQIAQPHNYDPAVAENELFKRVIPDVKAAFHSMNYQEFYKQTIQDNELALAFLSWSGVSDMIASIVNAIYSAANQDEFLTMKYMIQRAYLDGNIKTITIPTLTGDNIKPAVAQIKALSNTLTFMSNQYNTAGVQTFTPNTDQIVILDTLADALIDVELLAGAFNLPYANLLQQRVLVNDFTTNDYDRLGKLFAKDPTYKPFTQEEVARLKKIQMCVVDKSWFMIFDNLEKFTEQYNAQGLYWNYFFHVWKTFSYSPFKNAIMAISEDAGVTGLVVTPDEVTVKRGDNVNFQVTAPGSDVPPNVVWSLSNTHPQPGISTLVPLLSTITQDGIVSIAENEPNDVLYAIATDRNNPLNIAYAVINIKDWPKITGISIDPTTVRIAPGGTQQFTTTVTGTPEASEAYLIYVSGNTSVSTTITPDGLLTVGHDEKATTLTITAQSVQDMSFTAIAVVTVDYITLGTITINGYEVSSKQIVVNAGQDVNPLILQAAVGGIEDKTVTWTIPDPAPGLTITGSDTSILAIDFAESDMRSGTYTFKATSTTGQEAFCFVQVAVPPAIILSPASKTFTNVGTQQYTVTPYGIDSPTYTWEISTTPHTAISVSDTGLLSVVAGVTNGTYTVTCTETTQNVSATAVITVELAQPKQVQVLFPGVTDDGSQGSYIIPVFGRYADKSKWIFKPNITVYNYLNQGASGEWLTATPYPVVRYSQNENGRVLLTKPNSTFANQTQVRVECYADPLSETKVTSYPSPHSVRYSAAFSSTIEYVEQVSQLNHFGSYTTTHDAQTFYFYFYDTRVTGMNYSIALYLNGKMVNISKICTFSSQTTSAKYNFKFNLNDFNYILSSNRFTTFNGNYLLRMIDNNTGYSFWYILPYEVD